MSKVVILSPLQNVAFLFRATFMDSYPTRQTRTKHANILREVCLCIPLVSASASVEQGCKEIAKVVFGHGTLSFLYIYEPTMTLVSTSETIEINTTTINNFFHSIFR